MVKEVDAYDHLAYYLIERAQQLTTKRFPCQQNEPKAYASFIRKYYKFKIAGFDSTFGLLPESAVKSIEWPRFWDIDHEKRAVTLAKGVDVETRSKYFARTLDSIIRSNSIQSMKELRGEIIPTIGPDGNAVMHIDRAGSTLFGTVMYGVQMLAYTNTEQGPRYWVPRRARSLRAYPGMLDHCVGGALNSGETPMDCLVREADEEASLPESYVRANAKSFGVVSYHMSHNANNEEGHQPQVMYTYSIELHPDMVPKPSDGEVEKFELMTLDHVKAALTNREFKANCVLTWISYFISQGIINAENEKDLQKIATHLHRRLEFPSR